MRRLVTLIRRLVSRRTLGRSSSYLRKYGVRAFLLKAAAKLEAIWVISLKRNLPPGRFYELWIEVHELREWELSRQAASDHANLPSLIVVLPVDSQEELDRIPDALQAFQKQTYRNWTVHVASSDLDHEDRPPLASLQDATEDYIVFASSFDELAPNALYEIAKAGSQRSDLIYTDEDALDEHGKRSQPCFKPQWSPDLFRSCDFVTRLVAVRTDCYRSLNGLTQPVWKGGLMDLVLRAEEAGWKFWRIPKILVHRGPGGDVAQEPSARVVRSHLERSSIRAAVQPLETGIRIQYATPNDPLVSIIIPNHNHGEDLKRCIDSITSKSTYKNIEILIAENHSDLAAIGPVYEELQRDPRIRVLTWTKPFNYSEINNDIAREAAGPFLLFLNNDVEVISSGWIEEMLGFFQWKSVGAAGAKLYYPDGTIQHAGIILGLGGVAGHSHKHFSGDAAGHCGRLQHPQNLSGCTAACLLVRKSVFDAIGGFDVGYPIAFNDVDLCLRIREAGHLIVWTPYAELVHYESKTRGAEDSQEKKARSLQEINRFKSRWANVLASGDPYYNPNLALDREDFSMWL